MSRHSWAKRATALALSWVFPATTVWSATLPPAPRAAVAESRVVPAALWSTTSLPGPESLADAVRTALLTAPASTTSTSPAVAPLAAFPVLACPTCPKDTGALLPIVECVSKNDDGTYTARLGYESRNGVAVAVEVGPKNGFAPEPADRGQPRVFVPGRAAAVFNVVFDGQPLTWTLVGPDGKTRTATATAESARCAAEPECEVSLFGPQTYARTKGWKDVYEATIEVPGSVVPPYRLVVVNGKPDDPSTPSGHGPHARCPNKQCGDACKHGFKSRVAAAWIEVNGVEVVGPRDLGHHVSGLTRTVALSPTTRLKVTLAGAPGSYLTLRLCGRNGDTTPPIIAWTEPTPGAIIADPTPRLALSYEDPLGTPIAPDATEPVDPTPGRAPRGRRPHVPGPFHFGPKHHHEKPLPPCSTKAFGPKEFVRGWQKGKTRYQETLSLPAGVVGPFELRVKNGGDHRWARVTAAWIKIGDQLVFEPSDFSKKVDVISREVAFESGEDLVVELAGAPGSRLTIEICGSPGAVASGVDPTTLRVWLDDVERTDLFTKLPNEAFAELPDALALTPGTHTLTASIRDLAGHATESSLTFSVDVTPPTLTIVEPLSGSRHGSSTVAIVVRFLDDQRLDLGSLEARVDGTPIALAAEASEARGQVGPLADGWHELTVTLADCAGNKASASSRFRVDTALPKVEVRAPAPGTLTNDATPAIVLSYWDEDGVDPATLVVRINGEVRTDLFQVGPEGATAELPDALKLADGNASIVAQITDWTGNVGDGRSDFVVDTLAPTGAFEAPPAITSALAPLVRLTYSGTGTPVDQASVRVLLDGDQDVTPLLTLAEDGAQGALALDPPLSEGQHRLSLTLADRAGNVSPTPIEHVFVVDRTPPTASFTAPGPASFINDATPALRLIYADADGTGVDVSSVHVFLRPASPTDAPETETTTYFTIGADSAVGVIPDAAPLADGTYHLRAALADRAGNPAAASVSFVVDTVAPTYAFTEPGINAFVRTATPVIAMTYADDRSGVDLSALVLHIDGNDLSARLVREETRAVATLVPGDELADGRHEATLSIVDRGGNAAAIVPHPFVVDTTPPQVAIVSPAANAMLAPPVAVEVTFQDVDAGAGNAADLGSLQILVDGVDRVADFAVEPRRATASLALADGAHSIAAQISDLAGNLGSAVPTPFTVNSLPPVVAITAPADGSYHRATPVSVTGTVQSADPQVKVECRRAEAVVAATVTAGAFTCAVPLAEGENTVVVTAQDSLMRTSEPRERRLILDTIPPVVTIVEPPDGTVTSGTTVTVKGHVADASPVTVEVMGQAAACVASGSGGCDFEVSGVPLGSGSPVTLTATAQDAAGNTGSASTRVSVDRAPPTVRINVPSEGQILPGGVVEVRGSAADDMGVARVLVNGVEAEGCSAAPTSCTFVATIAIGSGEQTIVAVAYDVAGNEASDTVHVRVDGQAPGIVIETPAEGLITNATSVVVSGRVTDESSVEAWINRAPLTLGTGGEYSTSLGLPAEDGAFEIVVRARDAAGNESEARRSLIVDRTPPALTVVSPQEGEVVCAAVVTVQGLVVDATATVVTVDGVVATRSGNGWQVQFPDLPEGEHTFTIVATDAAGNQAMTRLSIVVDRSAPQVAITSPVSGMITTAPALAVQGTVIDARLVSLSVNGATATIDGVPAQSGVFVCVPACTFSVAALEISEGDTSLVATATDQCGRAGESAPVLVTRDSTPPVVDLTTPERSAPGQSFDIVATAADEGSGIAAIDIDVDGTVVASCAASPCSTTYTVPQTSRTSLAVRAMARDRAGNTGTAGPRVVMLAEAGAVVGQVLDDATTLVLAGAAVAYAGGGGAATAGTETDAQGRYSLPTRESQALLTISKLGYTSVERQVTLTTGVGTVPVDARLTLLSGPTTDAAPLEVAATLPRAYTLGIAAATVGTRLTPLSPQGLPNLLPLGWSPLAAFDLRGEPGATSLHVAFTASDSSPAPEGAVHLVGYSFTTHAWSMVAPGLALVDGALDVTLPGPGAYALVVPDDPGQPIAAVGEPLEGVDVMPLPQTAIGTGSANPTVVPPSGATVIGTLSVQSPTALPSGTVVQAEITESYTLTSSESAPQEKRRIDIVLYRTPATGVVDTGMYGLGAVFPARPSLTFQNTELASGEVVIDVFTGREAVRGAVGGSDPVTIGVGSSGASMSIPAGALPENTAFALGEREGLSSFVPSAPGVEPLREVAVDFSGQTLNLAAELSVPATGVSAGDTLLFARVERVEGIPRLVVVALGELRGEPGSERVYSRASADLRLPGVREGGRYVLYRVSAPIGFVAGTVAAGDTPMRALVSVARWSSSETWPFHSVSTGGAYILAAPTGSVDLSASVPKTSFAGRADGVDVTAASLTVRTIELTGVTTTASVRPRDQAQAVPVTVQVEIQASAPIRSDSATSATVRLLRHLTDPPDGRAAVPVRLVLSGSGLTLSVVPEKEPTAPADQPALLFSTTYTLEVTGLLDVYGQPIAVPTSTFTTKADVPYFTDPNKLVFSMPDENGLVKITVPGCWDPQHPESGCFYPGTEVLIINTANGIVLTLKAGNAGEIDAELPATVNDQLLVTITDPFGNVTSMSRSQYVDPATGETAVGPGGGVVTGPPGSGIEMRLPEGATSEGVKIKLSPIDTWNPTTMGEPPDLGVDEQTGEPLAHFGSGIRVETSRPTHFNKEVDLVFPVPPEVRQAIAAANQAEPNRETPYTEKDAFFYVLRKIEGPCKNGGSTCAADEHLVFYETLDFGQIEGEGDNAKVVTASYPFTGYRYGWERWDPTGGGTFGLTTPGAGAIAGVGACIAILMWTYTALLPGAPVPGVVTGRVLQPTWKPKLDAYGEPIRNAAGRVLMEQVMEGVSGLNVWGRDAAGSPFYQDQSWTGTTTATQGDGRFTLFDRHVVAMGQIVVETLYNGTLYSATGYQVQMTDTKIDTDPGLAALKRFGRFQNVVTANIVLPEAPMPLPPPQVEIQVTDQATGNAAGAVVIANTTLLMRFRALDGDLTEVKIQGQIANIQQEAGPTGMATGWWILQSPFTPSQAGTYTVDATAVPEAGYPVSARHTFRVVTAPGGELSPAEGPPRVLTPRTVPKLNARGVPVDTVIEISFSEPVTNVSQETITLTGGTEDPPFAISGVGVISGSGTPQTIPLDAVQPADTVVSITITPTSGLQYNATYTLTLTNGIEDLDVHPVTGAPDHKPLVPETTSFTTFAPANVGGTQSQALTAGVAVLGDRAYVADVDLTDYYNLALQAGILRIYDIADPVTPAEVGSPERIPYPPRSLAAQELEDGTRRVVVVAASKMYRMLQGELVYYYETYTTPSNLFVYDVTGDVTRWVGGMSLTNNIMDGTPNRVVVKDDYAYVATSHKGLQIVSLSTATAGFERFQVSQKMFNSGYLLDSVVTIATRTPTHQSYLFDLEVDDFDVDSNSRRLILATGRDKEEHLAIVDPATLEKLYVGGVSGTVVLDPSQPDVTTPVQMLMGQVIGLATVGEGRRLALLGGQGTAGPYSGPILIVVDVTSPRQPRVLSYVAIQDAIADILVTPDNQVIVSQNCGYADCPGRATFVNLGEDGLHPFVAGVMTGIAGRMALSDDGILLSSATGAVKATSSLGGVRTTALAHTAVIRRITPSMVDYPGGTARTEEAVTIEAAIVPADVEVASGVVELLRNGVVTTTLEATVSGAAVSAAWPRHSLVDPDLRYAARAVLRQEGGGELRTGSREIPLIDIVLINKEGQEVPGFPRSNPRPIVKLKDVATGDVTLLAGGTQAQVVVSGEVTDGVADIVPGNTADIVQVTVAGQSIPVRRVNEPKTASRPFAFRGTFSGTATVELGNGPNTALVESKNALGNSGFDSFTINMEQDITGGEDTATAGVYTPKFLDPYTIVSAPMTPDAVDEILFGQGVAADVTPESRLVETASGSLVFEGALPSLEQTSLHLNAPLAVNSDAARDVLAGSLTTVGLGIWGEELEFVETRLSSGVFRSAARRLPTNEHLRVQFSSIPQPSSAETIDVSFTTAEGTQTAQLSETSANSSTFVGVVSGLGQVSLELYDWAENEGTPTDVRIFFSSSTLDLDGYLLRLAAETDTPATFGTREWYPPLAAPTTPATPVTVVSARLVSVDNAESSDGGVNEPIWVVAKGLRFIKEGDYGGWDDTRLDLTLSPPPPPAQSSTPDPLAGQHCARYELPVMLAPTTEGATPPQGASTTPINVIRIQEERVSTTFWSNAIAGQSRVFRRDKGDVSVLPRDGTRGARLVVRLLVPHNRGLAPTTMTVEGGQVRTEQCVVTSSCPLQGPDAPPCTRYEMKCQLDIPVTEAPGQRDITVQYGGGRSKELKKAFRITRGRMVIFAVDGLSWRQWEQLGQATELKRIFAGPGHNVGLQLLTTFPSITLSRWLTMLSGRTPGMTKAASYKWLNRHRFLDGKYGEADQALKLDPVSDLTRPLYSAGCYNRHLRVPLVYDTLRLNGLRSIIVLQQSGRGIGETGAYGRDKWVRLNWGRVPWIVINDKVFGHPCAGDVDEMVVDATIQEIRAESHAFDLMMVYLPALDHCAHEEGNSSGEQYLQQRLLPRISIIVTEVRQTVGESTVFGLLSDHGAIDVTRQRYIDLEKHGNDVRVDMKSILQANSAFRPSRNLAVEGGKGPNVVFAPDGLLANIYVSSDEHTDGQPAFFWTAPPSLTRLTPLVNSIHEKLVNVNPRIVRRVLVRVPGANGFADSEYRVVPDAYQPVTDGCGTAGKGPCLLTQLQSLEDGLPADEFPFGPKRLREWISANTGDIVLLPDITNGYHFSDAKKGATHGSLTAGDGYVPLAFGYPWATGDSSQDTTLVPTQTYLEGKREDAAQGTPVEAEAILEFFRRSHASWQVAQPLP